MDKPDEPRQKFPHLIKSLFPRSRSLRSKGRSSLSSSSTIPTITGGVASDQGDISSSSASIATTAGQSTKTTVQSGEPPHNGCEDDSADEDGSVPGRNLRTIFGHDTRGLRIVYDPRSRGLEPVVDIVLIHGLGGDSYRTWRHKPDIFWPIDFLPQDLPEARVMTFGYDADAFKFFDDPVSQGSVHDHALSFIAEYSALRSQLRQEVRRDVIIIAHSLGGLVAKRAISISAQSAEISLRLLDASLSGIVFLGTPHQGSELADYADLAGKIFRLVPFNRRAINKRVLGVLRPNSEGKASSSSPLSRDSLTNTLRSPQGAPVVFLPVVAKE
jgi:pimeloyl-ACP methyl ester carboxylesterase